MDRVETLRLVVFADGGASGHFLGSDVQNVYGNAKIKSSNGFSLRSKDF